ncbi:hypothetical protein FGKAn22_17990 [Ferrigenium kumadai]|uniref:Lipoprotein n=1 Tax=Ferrigenium kumadai TaxID=1682490 RepID=A0AAN1T0V4_9PROT|nr:hypothetical protein [Ferrigenium kumadai]BBJ00107.1 hypothetical protein FGKAn22_17990 [Ferrigenium kumadai]
MPPDFRRYTFTTREQYKVKKVYVAVVAISLSACSTYMPQRYSINADTNVALKTIDAGNINVGSFKGPAKFDNSCRAAGPIAPPDSLSFEAYIQKALADELKVAGKFNDSTPKVTLSGTVEQLEFSSSRGLTGGSWDIGLKVSSSNGKSTYISEHYEFNSGFVADTACKQTAEAYLPAVQNLIGKLVKNPEFKSLVTP